MRNYELVLFDLDGTLLDTSSGIYNSVRFAETQLKLTPISNDMLRSFAGPPPKEMYHRVYQLSEETAFLATQKHREYSRTKAVYEAKVYPGIQFVLEELQSLGYKLGVTTLKSQEIAQNILEHYELSQYFNVVIGMDPKESLTKCRAIQLAIEQTATNGKAVLIGDSQYDYEGAEAAGVDFIGVLYGFGFERGCSYPFLTAETPEKVLEFI